MTARMLSKTLRALRCTCLAAAMAPGGVALAEPPGTFPERPVRFVVGFPPGGPSDILSRLVGQKLAEAWGQQVIVDNRPGAAGNVAAGIVARANADGHTMLLGNNSILATNVSLYRSLPYHPVDSFAPVIAIARQPNVLVVHPAVPARTVAELVALARAKPGSLNYASTGRGATAHLAAELFKSMAGVDWATSRTRAPARRWRNCSPAGCR